MATTQIRSHHLTSTPPSIVKTRTNKRHTGEKATAQAGKKVEEYPPRELIYVFNEKQT